MEYATLAFGLLLPWMLGTALLLAFDWPRSAEGDWEPGAAALAVGYGYVFGMLVLTFWMRLLSVAGIGFGRLSIGAPFLLAIAGLAVWIRRRRPAALAALRSAAASLVRPPLVRWERWLWTALLVWLALRLFLIAAEVTWRPLYPWDAWTQWASKARVWYELGRIVPFVPADVWLAGNTSGYFDAGPGNPSTLPLLQVWACIAFGSWDDAPMNWPWPLMLVALALAIYGALRGAGLSALGALIGTYLVASLPFLDAHAALAGYPDLIGSGTYTLAALAFHRWVLKRDARDAIVAAALALSCPLVESSGIIWALTLLPGIVAAWLPRLGLKLAGAGLAAIALVILALTRSDPTFLGQSLHLEYRAPWNALADAFLLLGNWHLVWYAVVVLAIIGARHLVRPPLAPLTMIVASGLGVLFVVAAFSNSTAWLSPLGSINRATLHLAPLLVCHCALLWRELTASPVVPEAASPPSPSEPGQKEPCADRAIDEPLQDVRGA